MVWLGYSPILEHFIVFQLVLTHSGQNHASLILLDSLLYEEFSDKVQNFSQLFGLFGNQFNWLCKTTHGQPPILACLKPESIMACFYLLQGTCRPPLGSEFIFGLNKVG